MTGPQIPLRSSTVLFEKCLYLGGRTGWRDRNWKGGRWSSRGGRGGRLVMPRTENREGGWVEEVRRGGGEP